MPVRLEVGSKPHTPVPRPLPLTGPSGPGYPGPPPLKEGRDRSYAHEERQGRWSAHGDHRGLQRLGSGGGREGGSGVGGGRQGAGVWDPKAGAVVPTASSASAPGQGRLPRIETQSPDTPIENPERLPERQRLTGTGRTTTRDSELQRRIQ